MVLAPEPVVHVLDSKVVFETDRLESQVLQEAPAVVVEMPFSRVVVVVGVQLVQVFRQSQVISR